MGQTELLAGGPTKVKTDSGGSLRLTPRLSQQKPNKPSPPSKSFFFSYLGILGVLSEASDRGMLFRFCCNLSLDTIFGVSSLTSPMILFFQVQGWAIRVLPATISKFSMKKITSMTWFVPTVDQFSVPR